MKNRLLKKEIIIFLLGILLGFRVIAQKSSWDNPALQKQEQSNIEKYRKGDGRLTVVDKEGHPVEGVTVIIHQKTHEFLFGCNLFALHQLATPELNRKYENAFTHLFNFATIPFYWDGIEPEKDSLRYQAGSRPIWRRPPPDELLEWCDQHGIEPKGHQLLYVKTKFMPTWISPHDSSELKLLATRRLEQISSRYSSSIPVWDAVNEEIARLENPQQWDEVPHDFLTWAFKKADSLFPKCSEMLINDETKTSHYFTQKYVDMVNNLLNQHIRVDGIGIQFHMLNIKEFLAGEIYTPEIMQEAYTKLGSIGKPLWISEITIPTQGENGLRDQATIVGDIYKLWFSQPLMKGITWWNLGDGTAFGKENNFLGGLLDSSMNPKPSFKVLDQLINHDWVTNTKKTTDKNGEVHFRGFYGRYYIEVLDKSKKKSFVFDLSSKSNYNHETLKL